MNKGRYYVTKKVAKKVISAAKNIAYERLYQRLETKENENKVFQLAKVRKRRIRDLGYIKSS